MKRMLRRWILYPIFVVACVGGGAAFLGMEIHDPDSLHLLRYNASYHTPTPAERERFRQYVISDEPNYWLYTGAILGGVLAIGMILVAEKAQRGKT